ncbi:MAG: ATP-binding cassette domain-containing protein, partial [Actinomyces succiniciruminis]|nr:ATP-binding cassette domain-containing protein [Actinomyces succiniciruminis]
PLRTLSGGMVQRVHLAAALVSRPALLLLDEPTVGLDPAQRIAFRGLVEGLEDTATVLATHLVEDVRALSDEIMVLDAGQVRFRGTTAALEAQATPDAPGGNQLERGYMSVLSQEQS